MKDKQNQKNNFTCQKCFQTFSFEYQLLVHNWYDCHFRYSHSVKSTNITKSTERRKVKKKKDSSDISNENTKSTTNKKNWKDQIKSHNSNEVENSNDDSTDVFHIESNSTTQEWVPKNLRKRTSNFGKVILANEIRKRKSQLFTVGEQGSLFKRPKIDNNKNNKNLAKVSEPEDEMSEEDADKKITVDTIVTKDIQNKQSRVKVNKLSAKTVITKDKQNKAKTRSPTGKTTKSNKIPSPDTIITKVKQNKYLSRSGNAELGKRSSGSESVCTKEKQNKEKTRSATGKTTESDKIPSISEDIGTKDKENKELSLSGSDETAELGKRSSVSESVYIKEKQNKDWSRSATGQESDESSSVSIVIAKVEHTITKVETEAGKSSLDGSKVSINELESDKATVNNQDLNISSDIGENVESTCNISQQSGISKLLKETTKDEVNSNENQFQSDANDTTHVLGSVFDQVTLEEFLANGEDDILFKLKNNNSLRELFACTSKGKDFKGIMTL